MKVQLWHTFRVKVKVGLDPNLIQVLLTSVISVSIWGMISSTSQLCEHMQIILHLWASDFSPIIWRMSDVFPVLQGGCKIQMNSYVGKSFLNCNMLYTFETYSELELFQSVWSILLFPVPEIFTRSPLNKLKLMFPFTNKNKTLSFKKVTWLRVICFQRF